MKKLSLDLNILNDFNTFREDNLVHLKIIICKSIQQHRGFKQPISDKTKQHKQIYSLFMKDQEERRLRQQSIFQKYDNAEMSSNTRSQVFSYVSKSQKTLKTFNCKLGSIINPSFQLIYTEVAQYQSQLRRFSLERINKQNRIGTFLREFQNLIFNRYKKEMTKFLIFYQSYGFLIDKRSERSDMPALRQQKYKLLLSFKSVECSIKCFNHYLLRISKAQNQTFQNAIKGIKQICLDDNYLVIQSIHQSIRQDGFCEAYISKIQKIYKDLTIRNHSLQKIFPISQKVKQPLQLQLKTVCKVQRQSFNGRKSMSESVARNLRNSNIQNTFQKQRQKQQQKQKQKQKQKQQQCQKQKEKQKPIERRSVLRQTLVQIAINDKHATVAPKQAQSHFSQIFLPSIKDKQFRHQAYNLYKRIYIVKQNS